MRKILGKLAKVLAVILVALAIIMVASIPLARMESPDDLLPVDNAQALAIDNVHLVTLNGDEILMHRQLLVRDGVIVDIRAAGSAVDSDYRRIDGDAAYVTPGLFDMHVHAMDRKYLALSLAYGVTSVRNMGGYPMHLRWKRELAAGDWLGSNLFTASPTMNGRKNANPLGHKVFTEPEKARGAVRDYQSQGYDFIKVYARLEVDVYKAIIEEAATLDFPVAGHVPYPVVEADYRLAAPLATVEHAEDIYQGPLDYQYDDAALEAIAAELREMDATVTPTLMIFDHLTGIAAGKQDYVASLPLDYLNPAMRMFTDRTSGARWLDAGPKLVASLEKRNAFFQTITRVLHESGVNLVLGSDAGVIYAAPGIATHHEIDLLAVAGLPPVDILRMATINAARALRVADRYGSIDVGKVADLVFTIDNPMDDLTTLRAPLAVVKNGQWLDQEDLDALKRSARNPSGAYLTMGRMLEFVLD